jgi:hypothetical protein
MKGIMYTPENIKLCANGKKTQTRRAGDCLKEINQNPDGYDKPKYNEERKIFWLRCSGSGLCDFKQIKPRYQVGEVAYIKEAHKFTSFGFALRAYIEYKDGESRDVTNFIKDGTTVYNQDHPEVHKWRSPRFMPEYAARYYQKILDVRLQRLMDISTEDCIAEGIEHIKFYEVLNEPVSAYRSLWDSINPEPLQSHHNPWVLAYTFKMVDRPQEG